MIKINLMEKFLFKNYLCTTINIYMHCIMFEENNEISIDAAYSQNIYF